MSDVTQILSQIESGDATAAHQLLPLVYAELCKLAAAAICSASAYVMSMLEKLIQHAEEVVRFLESPPPGVCVDPTDIHPISEMSGTRIGPYKLLEQIGEPAKLTKLVRGELDWIVMKALEKNRNRRYETAVGFAADFQRYLADEPCWPGRRQRLTHSTSS